jgi:hypothetical protein
LVWATPRPTAPPHFHLLRAHPVRGPPRTGSSQLLNEIA